MTLSVAPRVRALSSATGEHLKERFLKELARPASAERPLWNRIWRLLIEHPWSRRELQLRTRHILAQRGLPAQWREDLEHEALLLLARTLRRRPDLHLDHARAETHFIGWMRTILANHCRDALRRLRRLHPPVGELQDWDRVCDPRAILDARLDANEILATLNPARRAIVERFMQGWSIADIARERQLPYWTVYRTFQEAIKQLRKTPRGLDRITAGPTRE